MVAIDQVQEPAEEFCALLVGHAVDVFDVATDGEDALPPSDRVGADDRVYGLELGSDVLDGAAWLVVQLEAGLLGNLAETGLLKGDGEGLEKALVRLADAVIDLVTRCPEGVCG